MRPVLLSKKGVVRACRHVRPFTCFAVANKALMALSTPLNQATINRDGVGAGDGGAGMG
jgi:hypothetical protein